MYVGLVLAILLFAIGWMMIIVTFTKKDNNEKKETMEFLNNKEEKENNKKSSLTSITEEIMAFSLEHSSSSDLDEENTLEWTNEIF